MVLGSSLQLTFNLTDGPRVGGHNIARGELPPWILLPQHDDREHSRVPGYPNRDLGRPGLRRPFCAYFAWFCFCCCCCCCCCSSRIPPYFGTGTDLRSSYRLTISGYREEKHTKKYNPHIYDRILGGFLELPELAVSSILGTAFSSAENSKIIWTHKCIFFPSFFPSFRSIYVMSILLSLPKPSLACTFFGLFVIECLG